jgi:hypothetical protein
MIRSSSQRQERLDKAIPMSRNIAQIAGDTVLRSD